MNGRNRLSQRDRLRCIRNGESPPPPPVRVTRHEHRHHALIPHRDQSVRFADPLVLPGSAGSRVGRSCGPLCAYWARPRACSLATLTRGARRLRLWSSPSSPSLLFERNIQISVRPSWRRRRRGDALHTARHGVRQQHGDGRIEGIGSGQLLAQRAAQRVTPHHARPYAAQRRLLGGKVDGTQQRGKLGHLVVVRVRVRVRVRGSGQG